MSNAFHEKLYKWKRQCTTVQLYGTVNDYEVRYLHKLINEHFPEIVADQVISSGGINGMTLVAPIEDIKASLELVLELNEKIKTKYGERIQCIIDNMKVEKTLHLNPSIR